jgi:hypothetical protein
MKHHLGLLTIALAIFGFGCSTTTEVNGGLGNYNPGNGTGFSTVLAAGYNSSIFTSTDTCKTWHLSQGLSAHVYAIANSTHYVFAASTTSGVLRSSDNGNSWFHAPLFPDSTVYSLYASGSLVVAGCGSFGIVTSTDEGDSWSVSSSEFPAIFSMAGVGDRIFGAGSNVGLIESTDRGQTWLSANGRFNGSSASSVSVVNGDFYAVAGGEIFRSHDAGDSWTLLSNFSQVTYGIVQSKNSLFGGTTSGLVRSDDSGATWLSVPEIRSLVFRPAAQGNYVFAGTQSNGVFLSSDGGETWAQRNNQLFDTVILGFGIR